LTELHSPIVPAPQAASAAPSLNGAGLLAEPEVPWDLQHFAAADRLADYVFAELAPYVRGDVIEVGAGIGTFSRRILGAGARSLLTIEPEPGCANELERRFDADPRTQNIRDRLPEAPALRGVSGIADYVVCQNMLEHIEDDGASVAAMAQALKPGGHLSILVPNHPRLAGPLDRRYGHCRRYTRARLAAVLEGAGLEVERLYPFNALGIVGWVVQNRRSDPRISPASLRAYEALLRVWAPVERRAKLPFGLSLIAHARRV
jgi:SAM-dependent methyltransferase